MLGADSWPEIAIEFADSPALRIGEMSHPVDGGTVYFDPGSGRAVVPRPEGASLEDLVHPHVMVAAYLAATSRNEVALHAGACASAGGAWVFLGDHEQGKSTLLAMLSTKGLEPLTDDMVVLRNDTDNVCAGARCVDLRASAAEHLGLGTSTRFDTRSRISLPAVAAEHPLRGFLHLAWSSRTELRLLAARDRMARLLQHLDHLRRLDPARILRLASLPHYELSRPRDWNGAERSADLVRDLLAETHSR